MNTITHTFSETTTRTSRHPARQAPSRGARARRKSPVLSRRELRRLVRGMLG
jgi:hypothetical protein